MVPTVADVGAQPAPTHRHLHGRLHGLHALRRCRLRMAAARARAQGGKAGRIWECIISWFANILQRDEEMHSSFLVRLTSLSQPILDSLPSNPPPFPSGGGHLREPVRVPRAVQCDVTAYVIVAPRQQQPMRRQRHHRPRGQPRCGESLLMELPCAK